MTSDLQFPTVKHVSVKPFPVSPCCIEMVFIIIAWLTPSSPQHHKLIYLCDICSMAPEPKDSS